MSKRPLRKRTHKLPSRQQKEDAYPELVAVMRRVKRLLDETPLTWMAQTADRYERNGEMRIPMYMQVEAVREWLAIRDRLGELDGEGGE